MADDRGTVHNFADPSSFMEIEIKVTNNNLHRKEIRRRTVKKDRKLYQTKYFIMVNSNVRPKDQTQTDAIGKSLIDALTEILENQMPEIIRFNYEGHEWSPEYIKSAHARVSLEVGKSRKGGRAHIHAILDIWHWSNIRAKPKAFTDLMRSKICTLGNKDLLGIKNIYVTMRWVKSDWGLENYINKDLVELETAVGTLSLE